MSELSSPFMVGGGARLFVCSGCVLIRGVLLNHSQRLYVSQDIFPVHLISSLHIREMCNDPVVK